MTVATYQPELCIPRGDGLTHIADYVFEPTVVQGYKYTLDEHPDFYFVVRPSCSPDETDRVCVYRTNVVNVNRFGNDTPSTLWVSNELRANRTLVTLRRDMLLKVEDYLASCKVKKNITITQ